MKLKLFLIAASAMALASCSSDEVVKNNEDANAIAFSVTANKASRAANYWCNARLPKYFEVSANFDSQTYFEGDVYSLSSSTKYVQDNGNYRYWPAVSGEKPLEIYAYKVKKDGASAIGAEFAQFAWNNGAPKITMAPEAAAKDQDDLLYAYTQGKVKPAFGETKAINFRHALSQVVFYGLCTNENIYVEIEEIALCNAAKSGVFTLPTAGSVTDDNFDSHAEGNDGKAKSTGLGTWKLTYDPDNITRYTANCTTGDPATLKALTSTKQNLTDNATESDYGQSLLVLPQTKYSDDNNNNVKAYNPKGGASGAYQGVGAGKGAYIAVKCKIRNIAGNAVTANDVYLHGSAGAAADLVIPVDFTWEQGKKYIYTINFTATGHGGYDPGTGKEVLVPIELSVTVDDFGSKTEINIDAEGKTL